MHKPSDRSDHTFFYHQPSSSEPSPRAASSSWLLAVSAQSSILSLLETEPSGSLGDHSYAAAAAAAKSLQSCPTLCDPRDGSPLDSPVPEILQARVLEWSAIAFSDSYTVTVTRHEAFYPFT